MEFLSVSEMAKQWNGSQRSTRNYCVQGRVAEEAGAFLTAYDPGETRSLIEINHGLAEWGSELGHPLDTCLSAQDGCKAAMDHSASAQVSKVTPR